MRRTSILLLAILWTLPSFAVRLQPAANTAFESCASRIERQLEVQHRERASFLALSVPNAMERMKRGEVVVEPISRDLPQAPGAMLHHWRASAFISGASAADFLRAMQDYDHLAERYKPQVVSSKLTARNGNEFQFSMRLRQHKVITVVMDSDYDVRYGALDAAHGYSLSHSTRVAEIADAGKKDEHALSPEESNGFLWRINTYWTYAEVDGGLAIQCETLSLTRDIPRGLGWIVRPFVESVPRESLEFTLNATRKAIQEESARRKGESR